MAGTQKSPMIFDPIANQQKMVAEFKRNCVLRGVLQCSPGVKIQPTDMLTIPKLSLEHLTYSALEGRLYLDLESIAESASVASATSVETTLKPYYSINELRTFAHDFTMSVLATGLDERLDRNFPILQDGFDDKTPDLIIADNEAKLVVEFTTSRFSQRMTLQSKFEEKKFKYLEPLRVRVEAERAREPDTQLKYGFSILVVSQDCIYQSRDLNLEADLVNELCARYRFALSLLTLAEQQGVVVGEDNLAQLKIDIIERIKTIKPVFDGEDGLSLPIQPNALKEESLSVIIEESSSESSSMVSCSSCKDLGKKRDSETDSQDGDSLDTFYTARTTAFSRRGTGLNWADDLSEIPETEETPRDETISQASDLDQPLSRPIVAMTRERIENSHITTKETMAHCFQHYKALFSTVGSEVDFDRGNDLEFAKLLEELSKENIGLREDYKAPIQLPAIIPSSNCEALLPTIEGIDPYASFWNDVLIHTNTDEWAFELTEEELIERALAEPSQEAEDMARKSRRKYKRVKIDLTSEQRVEFAKVGVQGKDKSLQMATKEYRDQRSVAFSLSAPTEDIDNFLHLPPFETSEFCQGATGFSSAYGLIVDSTAQHECPDPAREFMTIISMNCLASLSSFYSDVGEELCISIKQNVRRDEFVVKKLRRWGAYIAIKPTKGDSHIFFTLLIPREGATVLPFDTVFKQVIEKEDFYIVPWCSYNVAKLVNLVKCESFYAAMLSQWSRYYEMTVEEGHADARVLRMCRLTWLIHLEDRLRTEEIFTLFRYISMEKFSTVKPRNDKMLEKLPNILWSRLQVWAVKKLVFEMCQPNYKLQTYKKDEEDIDMKTDEDSQAKYKSQWVGMRNPYTGESVMRPQSLIELYYLGYCTNKEAKVWKNTEFELVKKIVKYEMELAKANPKYCGLYERENPRDYKFHEWSKLAVLGSADAIRCYLSDIYGSSWMITMNEVIVSRLARLTWEQVATLKASSTFDPETSKEELDKKSEIKRITVLVAVLKKISLLEDTPALSVPKILEAINERGGLNVDIFRKAQHGGIREIYVLDLYSRVLQLCIEEIARAFCSQLSSEIMMHPQNKIRRPQEHMYQAAIDPRTFKSNVSSSNDAKVWNQGHHVVKFAQFMCRLTDPIWHGLIVTGLRQWMTKRILLPTGVIDFLKKDKSPELYDPIHQAISNAFKGLTNEPWLEKGSYYMTIESGMMQGILHYTSSLFHCGFLILRDELFKSTMKHLAFDVKTTDLVSSDDSARITDVFCKKKDSLLEAHKHAITDQLLIEDFSKLAGIHMSIKSTYCTTKMLEFNSEFFIGTNLIRPTFKWAAAALNIIEVENLFERQENCYNLITSLLEGGSGFRQAFETQICQAVLHYRLMGSIVNPIFEVYSTDLIKLKDPALGYFFMDHPLSAGLFGLSYSFWVHLKNCNNLSKLYRHLMKQETTTTTTTGKITRGCQIRFGNREKAKRIISAAEAVMPDWRERVEENPEVLYRVGRNLTDSTIKILVKLTGPNVTTSLSKGNSIAKMLASSVYLINGLATTVGSNWMSLDNEMGSAYQKRSLLFLLKMSLIYEGNLDALDVRVLFPHHEHYETLELILKRMSTYKLVLGGSKKTLRSHVLVLPDPVILPFTLEQMVKRQWFSDGLPASREVLSRVWAEYCQSYTWLRSDPHSTLAASDAMFETQVQLRNFIARQGTHSRTVHLTGSPLRDSAQKDLVANCLLLNQLYGHKLVEPTGKEVPLPLSLGDELLNTVACILTFPFNQEKKEMHIRKALLDQSPIWDGQVRQPHSRRVKLAIFQHYVRFTENQRQNPEAANSLLFETILKNSRLGVVGGFKRIQKFAKKQSTPWSGQGSWQGTIGSCHAEITMSDDQLTGITVNSIHKLRENISLLNNLCKEFGLTTFKIPTAPAVFLSKVYYDLKSITFIPYEGVPIREVPDLTFFIDYDPRNMMLNVGPDYLKLQMNSGYKLITVTTHRVQNSDYKFAKEIGLSTPAFSEWCQNKPLTLKRALLVLDKVMSSGPSNYLDKVAAKDFIRETLWHSLLRNGWCIRKNVVLETQFSEVQDNEIEKILSGCLGDEDWGGLEVFTEAPVGEDVLDFTCLVSDFEDAERIFGTFGFEERQRSDVNIMQVHTLWDRMTNHWMGSVGRIERKQIESGITPKLKPYFLKYLKFYLNLEFTTQEPEEEEEPQTAEGDKLIVEQF